MKSASVKGPAVAAHAATYVVAFWTASRAAPIPTFAAALDLAPLTGVNVVSGGQLHLLADRGVLIALLDQPELGIRHVQVHLCAEEER